jgi:uncharacterized protein (TIGR04222 family)
MDWLIHNPIADIHGPAFLLVYGAIALIVIFAADQTVRARDKSGLRAPPPVPPTFDPYELAYLRGGNNAVIRTVLYALHRRGLVTVTPKKRFSSSRLAATGDLHDAGTLTELEQLVLQRLSKPADPSSLFGNSGLESSVDRLCRPFQAKLESERLLRTEAMKEGALLIPLVASFGLFLLTLYKVTIAAADHRPVGYLLILTIVALVILWVRVGRAVRARVSDRGNAYLKQLQTAYENRRPGPRSAGPASQAGPSDLPSVAMVGLFGFGILAATPDAAFAGLFAKGAAGGGGCGGGCGSGGGDGGGCGGGCGG